MSDNGSEIQITLDGAPVTLRATAPIAMAINAHFGGFVRAFERVAALDLDAVVRIIRMGSGVEGEAAAAQAGAVFAKGVSNLAGPLSSYIKLLVSGGRTSPED